MSAEIDPSIYRLILRKARTVMKMPSRDLTLVSVLFCVFYLLNCLEQTLS